MVTEIFSSLPDLFVPGEVDQPVSYYFSLGETKKTVTLMADNCLVEDGRTVERADCVCKTSEEFFKKIWEDDYRPGVGDFLSGKIKSNDPNGLQAFLKSFGKNA